MSELERVGVSLERGLLAEFDKHCERAGYTNRSEAIRDLIREKLNEQRITDDKAQAFATVCFVYDHHKAELSEKLVSLQHSHVLQTISTLHVHLDKHDCLEVIVLKGNVGVINSLGEKMLSLKGVLWGKVNIVGGSIGKIGQDTSDAGKSKKC